MTADVASAAKGDVIRADAGRGQGRDPRHEGTLGADGRRDRRRGKRRDRGSHQCRDKGRDRSRDVTRDVTCTEMGSGWGRGAWGVGAGADGGPSPPPLSVDAVRAVTGT